MRVLGALALLVGCYSPSAAPGAPCSPSLDNCPAGQTCTQLGTMSVCVEGSSTIDAPRGTADAPRDAPNHMNDAPPDAAVPAWTLVQTASSMMPNVMINATGAGHLIVVAVQFQVGGQVQLVTDSVGDMFTAVPSSTAMNNNANLAVQLFYTPSSQAGAVQVAASATSYRGIAVWEVAGMRTTNPIDVVAVRNDGASSTAPTGAPVTTTAAGDFIVSTAIVANSVTGTTAGNEFTNDESPNGNGFAHLTAPRAPAGLHQARWDQPTTGVYCSSTAAFFVAP